MGLNNFTIQVFDGLAINQSTFTVFVDTTVSIQTQDTVAIVNQEFIYIKIPVIHGPKKKYSQYQMKIIQIIKLKVQLFLVIMLS